MTVVVWKDGVIAADSMVSLHGIPGTGTKAGSIWKIRKRGNILAGAAGSIAQVQSFLNWFALHPEQDPPIIEKEANVDDSSIVCHGIILMPCGHVLSYDGREYSVAYQPQGAIGSGMEYALGALAMGASAEEAVEATIRCDFGFAPPVRVLRNYE